MDLPFGVGIHVVPGTAILLKPGIIAGGPVTHECPLSRSIGYFLEPVIMLAPFAKKPLQLTLRGITTDDNDLSVSPQSLCCPSRKPMLLQVDIIRTVTLPHLQLFGVSEGLELRVRLRVSTQVNSGRSPVADQEARQSTSRRRRSTVLMSHRETGQDPQLR